MNLFTQILDSTARTISAVSNATVGLAELTEETVDLARNEVANLQEMQQIRLDEVRADRAELAGERSAKLASLLKENDSE